MDGPHHAGIATVYGGIRKSACRAVEGRRSPRLRHCGIELRRTHVRVLRVPQTRHELAYRGERLTPGAHHGGMPPPWWKRASAAVVVVIPSGVTTTVRASP